MQRAMAAVAFRLAWLLVVDVTRIAAIRDMETSETASAAADLVEALENRNRGFSAGPPVDLDGTVAKKGWECGMPEKDVPNRELVKNAKRKAQYLIYKWLKKKKCPEQQKLFWRAIRPFDIGKKERGELCKSDITGALADIEGWRGIAGRGCHICAVQPCSTTRSGSSSYWRNMEYTKALLRGMEVSWVEDKLKRGKEEQGL